jgi:hypothetical protein
VQQAREAARRTQCKNNLKQIGLALHNYHDVYNQFPLSIGWGIDDAGGSRDRRQAFSDKVYLTPYLEQSTIYQQLNVNDFPYNPWERGSNLAQSGKLPVFNCPSNGVINPNGTQGMFTYAINNGVMAYSADNVTSISGYEGRHNGFACYVGERGRGNPPVNFATITDGSSNTAAYAEFGITTYDASKLNGPSSMQLRDWVGNQPHRQMRTACRAVGPIGGGDVGRHNLRGSAWAWSFVGNGASYSHNTSPNEAGCYSHEGDWNGSGAFSASSYHTGGVQICLADGSVRFISNNLDYDTWVYLGVRNDGKVLGDF